MRLAALWKARWRSGATVVGLTGLLLAGFGAVLPANAATAGSAAQSTTPAPQDSTDAMRFVAAMQPGYNVGNSLDAIPTETSWGNPPISQALLLKAKSLGYRSIRVPVTWGIHEGAAPGYTVDPAFMARVKQVVDWALSDGFYVVLNVHHDSWQWITNMPTDPSGVTAHYEATWIQIADEFKNEPRKLIFEADNEQGFSGVSNDQGETLLNALQTDFFNIVRQSGGRNATRYLLLSTLGDTPSKPLMDALYTEIESLHDPDLIASFHYYGFWPFGVNIAGYNTFDATSQQDMDTDFSLMHSEFIARGIPVYDGEVGLFNDYNGNQYNIERGETLKYYEALGYEARINGVTLNYWDDGGRIINRNTLQLFDPGTFALTKAAEETRSGTASNDTVYVPKASPITDKTLTLNLNSLSFRALYDGSQRLREGSDYTLAGDQLTLASSLVTRLVGAQSYGVNATLEARFSDGVPWQINVVTNAAPVLAAASGTTGSFTIPTAFDGDMLSMMQSVYPDGSNAGQASWTAYQEYGSSFSADYANRDIVLTSAFLDSLTDGSRVSLTFHFWSGATATYYVTKPGSTVTGSLS